MAVASGAIRGVCPAVRPPGGISPTTALIALPRLVGLMSASGRVQAVTDASFAQFTASGLALVDFSAEWCPPCKRMDPLVEQLAQELPGVAVGRLDVDANPRTAAAQGVLGMPTFIVYKDGRKVDQVVGAVPKPRLAEAVRRHL